MIEISPNSKVVFELSMNSFEYNDAKIEGLRREIAKKYGLPLRNVCVDFKPIVVNEKGEKVSLTADIINNIQDPKFQQKLFKEYIELKGIEGLNFDDILAIDNSVNAFVNFDAFSKYKSYKFKYAKWKNYLSYGEENYIDFTKLHGLVLLCGNPQNQSGKSSFARNLLRFALFGRAEKSPQLSSVFNSFLPEATEVLVEVGIEIEGEDYVIRRTITRPALKKRTEKSKYKQTVEYFKKIQNGDLEIIENCEDESNTQTNNVIRDSIGTIEDFDLIISATSKTLSNLIDMGQTEQGKLFSRWLGLLSLSEKESIAKDMYKRNIEPTLLSRAYNKEGLQQEVVDMETVIKGDEEHIKNSEAKLEESKKKLADMDKEKTLILGQKREIKQDLLNVDMTTIDNHIAQNNAELERARAIFNQDKARYNEIKDVTFDEVRYKQLQAERDQINIANGGIKTEINTLRNEIAYIKDLMAKEICPTCGGKIDVKEKTEIITEKEKIINEKIAQGVRNKERIDAINAEIAKLEENRNLVNEVTRLRLKLTANKTSIDNYKLRIENLVKTKAEIEANFDNIKFNNEVANKIRLVDVNIATETRVKEGLIREIEEYRNEIKNFKVKIDSHKQMIAKLLEEEKVIRNWNIYKELIGKNGITKMVLKRALPIINNEVRTLLNGLVDFDVEMSISDDNKICIDLVHDGVSMSIGRAASGYEETMASLALRSALARVSSFAKPNMLVLDEIFGATGSSHYDDIKELLNRIMNNHDFIIDITHNEMITDWHNQIIEVQKVDNISHLYLK